MSPHEPTSGAASTSVAPRFRPWSSTAGGRCSARRAGRRRPAGGPEGRRRADGGGAAGGGAGGGGRAGHLAGVGVGSPGDVNGRTGTVSQARNLPGWEREFKLGAWLHEPRGAGPGRQRRAGRDRGRVPPRRRPSLQVGGRRVLGHRGRRRTGARRQALAGARRAGEIGHIVVKKDGARCPCGRRGCMEAYAGRAAMEARARRSTRTAARPTCSRSWRSTGATG